MRFFDNHIHSQFSPDSRMSLYEGVRRASAQGIAGIAFTDHLDLDAPRGDGRFTFDVPQQQAEIARVERLLHSNQMASSCDMPQILRGIEVGLQPCSIEHTRQFTSSHKFDVVIASIHFIDGEDPFLGEYFKGKDYKRAYGRVLELIYSTAVAYGDFDILGHFDYVARYSPYDVRDICYRDFPEVFDAILSYLAKSGKAIELNTKTYLTHNGHLQKLDLQILKRFKELGGSAISFGSDSHEEERIGENFDVFWEVVKGCGFQNLVYFKDRKMVFYNPEKI